MPHAGSVMAKSKNHTAHNQTYKAHRHSIKKPKKSKYSSRKGVSVQMQLLGGPVCRIVLQQASAVMCWDPRQMMSQSCKLAHHHASQTLPMQMDPKFLRNQRYAKKHTTVQAE